MMEKKYIKPAIAAGVIVLLVILAVVTGVGEKLVRLGTISKNIAIDLSNATHGDPRSLDEMSVEFIEANTGCTDEINQDELPKALKPFKKYGHPPFTMGACSVCHSPKRSKPAAIVTHTVSELCYKCHEPQSKITAELEALDCNKCHSPHHADRKKLLRDNVTEESCPVGKFI